MLLVCLTFLVAEIAITPLGIESLIYDKTCPPAGTAALGRPSVREIVIFRVLSTRSKSTLIPTVRSWG
jgi:hypothetical protein